MMTKEESTKIVNFMIIGAGADKSYDENAIFLLFFCTLGGGKQKLSSVKYQFVELGGGGTIEKSYPNLYLDLNSLTFPLHIHRTSFVS